MMAGIGIGIDDPSGRRRADGSASRALELYPWPTTPDDVFVAHHEQAQIREGWLRRPSGEVPVKGNDGKGRSATKVVRVGAAYGSTARVVPWLDVTIGATMPSSLSLFPVRTLGDRATSGTRVIMSEVRLPEDPGRSAGLDGRGLGSAVSWHDARITTLDSIEG